MPDWIKNKKEAINPISYDNKYSQYAATDALNHERKYSQRISKLGKKTGKCLRKTIQQLLLMCYMFKKMNIHPAYNSKNNLNYEKQI